MATAKERQFLRLAFFLGATAWLLSFLYAATVPLFDDEVFYAAAGGAIGKFLTGHLTFLEMRTLVVSNGWFTPGVPFLLAPIYVIDATPHSAVIRLYASVLTFGLWMWALREAYRVFGPRYAIALFIFPALDVTWHLLATGAWGDLPSGLLLVIILGRTWQLAQLAFEGAPVKIQDVVVLEAIFILTFYLRGNSILAFAAVHVFLIGVAVLGGQWRMLPRQVGALTVGVVLFIAGIAPWSIMASRELGGTVISTSTPALSFAITFGKREFLCFAPCPRTKGNVWYDTADFSRTYAAEHGISQLEAQRRMAASATRDLTFTEYTRRTRANFQRFLFRPAGFTQNRFLPRSAFRFSEQTVRWAGAFGALWTGLLYFPFLLALAVANGLVITKGWREQLESLCLKMFTICVLVQPFIHPGHSRYWPTFGPLMAFSGAFLIKRATRDHGHDAPGSIALTLIQGLYVLLVLATVAALFLPLAW